MSPGADGEMTGLKHRLARMFPQLYTRWGIAQHRLRFARSDATAVFSHIFRRNAWEDEESRSGPGSNLIQTARVREALPGLLADFEVRSLLDIPCGDFFWMSQVRLDLEQYIGADIVAPLVEQNSQRYGNGRRSFAVKDITKDALPVVDLVFCRDCLVHLSFADIGRALARINESGARFLLTTTFVGREANRDIPTGVWRPLNLEKPPFELGPPLRLINEGCTEEDGQHADKSLGLWSLPLRLAGRGSGLRLNG